MPLKESFKRRFDNSLRVASVASLALAPHTPVFSPQEKAQSAEREGNTLTLDTPLNPNGIPPLETPDGRKVVFGRETYEQQATEDEQVVAEIRRIFELRDLAAVEKNIPPGSIAWMTTASRYLFLSREQAMGVFRTAFERRQPQCLAFGVFGEGQNRKISVLMKDFGVLEWDGVLSAASSIGLTSHQGGWFISSVGEFPRSTLEEYTQRNSANLRPCPPRALERQEQVQSQEVSVFGLSAEFTDKGNIVISSMDGKKREINLPPLAEFYTHLGGMEFSPDGTKLVAWRDSHDKGKEGYTLFLISPQTGEFRPIFSDFVGSLNYLSRFIDLEWTQDSKKLRIASGHHGRGKGIVVDIDTEQVLFEYRGGTYGKFSPDGDWFARKYGDKDLEVRRISDGYRFTVGNNNGFSWSPDSQSLALNKCTRWTETVWGDACEAGVLSLYNISTRRSIDNITQTNVKERPVFSPDGKKILFVGPSQRGPVYRIYDLPARRIIPVGIGSYPLVAAEGWVRVFHTSGKLLIYNRQAALWPQILWIDTESGAMVNDQMIDGGSEKVVIKKLFERHVVYEVLRNDNRRDVYVAEITGGRGAIRGQFITTRLSREHFRGEEDLLGLLKDRDLFAAGEQHFLFMGGKRHLIKHEETAGYFGGQKSSLPEGLAWFIPEGEPIEFRPGDVVGHKDLGIWYLRNGKRYKVQNWDWFTTRLRYSEWNAPRALEAPRGWPTAAEVISRIPVGDVPGPSSGREGILDWDEKEKMHQPYGGRMIIFMGGYDGSSAGQLEAFQNIKAKLLEQGWRESHFLEASYSIDQRLLRAGVILPRPYESSHTALHPSFHVSHMSLQLQRYKEIFPLTKFILIGHSLGGYGGFGAALKHTDSVEMVITLDSPLKGVDRVALNEHFGPDIDRIIGILGEAVGRYLVSVAEDPAARQAQEDKAAFLRSQGIRVFTFSNDDDWFVRNRVSVLDNSDSEFDGEPVELIRHLGHFSPRGPGDFLTGHGQILQEGSFLEELVRILPAS